MSVDTTVIAKKLKTVEGCGNLNARDWSVYTSECFYRSQFFSRDGT